MVGGGDRGGVWAEECLKVLFLADAKFAKSYPHSTWRRAPRRGDAVLCSRRYELTVRTEHSHSPSSTSGDSTRYSIHPCHRLLQWVGPPCLHPATAHENAIRRLPPGRAVSRHLRCQRLNNEFYTAPRSSTNITATRCHGRQKYGLQPSQRASNQRQTRLRLCQPCTAARTTIW